LGVVIFGSLVPATPFRYTTGPTFLAVYLALVWDVAVAKGGMESGEEPHRGRCGLGYRGEQIFRGLLVLLVWV